MLRTERWLLVWGGGSWGLGFRGRAGGECGLGWLVGVLAGDNWTFWLVECVGGRGCLSWLP